MSTVSRKDRTRLMQAAAVAEGSECEQRLGALLVAGSRVLSVGHNKRRNSTLRSAYHAHTEHAERAALRRVEDASGTTLYVARLTRGGVLGISQPCARCMTAAIDAGVSRVVYMGRDEVISLRIGRLRERSDVYRSAARRVVTQDGYVKNLYWSDLETESLV